MLWAIAPPVEIRQALNTVSPFTSSLVGVDLLQGSGPLGRRGALAAPLDAGFCAVVWQELDHAKSLSLRGRVYDAAFVKHALGAQRRERWARRPHLALGLRWLRCLLHLLALPRRWLRPRPLSHNHGLAWIFSIGLTAG